MSDTKALYEDFWQGFLAASFWPNDLVGSPEKPVHRSEGKPINYYDFDRRLGLGFRPTAAISARDDKIAAQISCGEAGRGFVAAIHDKKPDMNIPKALGVQPHVNNTDAKIEIVWKDANIKDRNLWPVHYLWLFRSLEILVCIFEEPIKAHSND